MQQYHVQRQAQRSDGLNTMCEGREESWKQYHVQRQAQTSNGLNIMYEDGEE